jgi:hypothetical protein
MALPVKGFDGQEDTLITHLMFLNLQIGVMTCMSRG